MLLFRKKSDNRDCSVLAYVKIQVDKNVSFSMLVAEWYTIEIHCYTMLVLQGCVANAIQTV